jgi:molybdopterin-guanine dinucleotide biosynthesis protein A
MDAVVIAGGIPQPGEPLYEATRGIPKAMLDIAGKPMVQWVLDALSGATKVERVFLVGLPPDSVVSCTKPMVFIPSQGDLLENIRSGVAKVLELNPQAHHVLIVSSDIPGITPTMVDWEIDTTMQTDHEIYYHVIQQEVMEKRYPGSRRSYIQLRDMRVCGGDMNVVRAQTVVANEDIWKKLVDARKSALKQAALVGFDTMLMVLFHVITLERAVKVASRRLKVNARVIVSPYAEIGMDVDKPHQLEIMRLDLGKQLKIEPST